MIKYILFDAGHGQETPGKRSPVWDDGKQLLEWEFNRSIRDRVLDKLTTLGYASNLKIVNEGDIDWSLKKRTDKVNSFAKSVGPLKCLLISIHSDAFTDPKANGFTAFHQPGSPASQAAAGKFAASFAEHFPDRVMRGNKGVREKNLHMTRESVCPAVLLECFFMTNEWECRNILLTEGGRNRVANAIVDACVNILSQNRS